MLGLSGVSDGKNDFDQGTIAGAAGHCGKHFARADRATRVSAPAQDGSQAVLDGGRGDDLAAGVPQGLGRWRIATERIAASAC